MLRKKQSKYYFSVEGETERWYLEWLQKTINACSTSSSKVVFECPVQPNPLKMAKNIVITSKTEIYHLSDYESDEPIHVKEFQETMDNMKKACSVGKQIKYFFGYTNLTFDLWIVLHMSNCSASINDRKQYLSYINKAYGENFESMTDYKKEANFKRILNKLTINNVIDAIHKSEKIMKNNHDMGYTLHQYKGFKYYRENPSLEIHTVIKKILTECGLMKS